MIGYQKGMVSLWNSIDISSFQVQHPVTPHNSAAHLSTTIGWSHLVELPKTPMGQSWIIGDSHPIENNQIIWYNLEITVAGTYLYVRYKYGRSWSPIRISNQINTLYWLREVGTLGNCTKFHPCLLPNQGRKYLVAWEFHAILDSLLEKN